MSWGFLKKLFWNRSFVDNEEVDYDIVYQRLMTLINNKRFVGICSEDIDVKLWLPEMNGVNVTILCDKFLKKHHTKGGIIALITNKDDINCVSILNIEQQSSGFKIFKQEDCGNKTLLCMAIRSDKVKTELLIPDNYDLGFVWRNKQNSPIPSHIVRTSEYNSDYILNFSVSGEFHLDIIFVPLDEMEPIMMFSKDFCCK